MMKSDMWFVYDGECPICQLGASYYRFRQSIGTLHTLDARTNKDHPLIQEINRAGLDMDQGMVIKFDGKLYHGPQAWQRMAELGEPADWFNKANRPFRNPWLARCMYPLMKAGRNLALAIKRKGKIRNLEF